MTKLNALTNGDNEKTHRYIHEEDRVKCKSFPPRINSSTHEWISSPWTPGQCNTDHNDLQNDIVFQHADQGSNIQREQTVAQETQALEEDYVAPLNNDHKKL